MLNIYVGNLSFNTTESELSAAFEAHGEVVKASIITDRETGRSRGFGFIEMANNDEGQAAIEAVNGFELDGRTLTVNEARPRSESGGRESGGGGGGGDRGGYGGGGGDRY